MASKQSVHMNRGEGVVSYARNSSVQRTEQNRMKPIIEEAVIGLLNSTNTQRSIVITDLGCSTGPNAVALVSIAVDAIFHHYAQINHVPPELCVLLNDLPDNDFNNVAKSLVSFQQRFDHIGPVLTGIVPGSFYKRLFKSESVHLVLTSISVQWLSEVPEDLKVKGIPIYDDNEDLRVERRPLILKAYAQQFRKDFTLFLRMRAQELVSGGRMVISVPSMLADNDLSCQSSLLCDYLSLIFHEMVSRGVITREKADSFYLPLYGPSDKEIREIIEENNNFEINKMEVHRFLTGMEKGLLTPKMWVLSTRAALEPIIIQHFGDSGDVMDEFVRTLERHVTLIGLENVGAIRDLVFLCVSLTKKI